MCRSKVIVVPCIFALLLIVLLPVVLSETLRSQGLLPGPGNWDELPDATYEIINEREVVTTVPRTGDPKGILFSLHGCLQLTTEWGFDSESCPNCNGMPEEMVSVYRAVKRGYALVALGPHLSDAERNFQCFNTTWPPENHFELPTLLVTLRELLTARDWWHLPRFAYGSSRGGAMTLILALRFPFQAVGSMVMGMRPAEVMEAELQPRNLQSSSKWTFPPTMLMAAANDQDEILDLVNTTEAYLLSKGVKVEKLMMQPYQLTPRTFAERMKGIDLTLSETIFEELKAVEIIRDDNQSHFGWYESWKKAEAQLKKILLKHFPADLGARNGSRGVERAFREMLWASEAIHELSAEPMDAMLDFFEASAVTNESPLHERHPFVQIPARIEAFGGTAATADAVAHMQHKHKHHTHAHSLGEVHTQHSVPSTGAATGR